MKTEDELFNEDVMQVLECAQQEGIGYINSDLPLELMELGYINKIPREEWSISGYKATSKGVELYTRFLKRLREIHGHIWEVDEDGKIDQFGYTAGDNHNGYKCSICGYGFCKHCRSEFDIPKCSPSLKDKQDKIKELQKKIDNIQRSIK